MDFIYSDVMRLRIGFRRARCMPRCLIGGRQWIGRLVIALKYAVH
jgi:hypothetical protein